MMSVEESLRQKDNQLTGNAASEDQIRNLKSSLPERVVPEWYLSLLRSFPISGTCFSLDEEDDLSEMGADLKWLTPEQAVDEALNVFPGKSVLSYRSVIVTYYKR